MKRLALLAFVAVTLICVPTTASAAGPAASPSGGQRVTHAKVDRYLRHLLNTTQHGAARRVIVRVRNGDEWTVYQSLLNQGATVTHYYPQLHAFAATVKNDGGLNQLDADDAVTDISADATVTASALGTSLINTGMLTTVSPDTLRQALGLVPDGGATYLGPTGEGIGVALIDSGLSPSSDVAAERITAFYDFTQGGILTTPSDGFGHGTHVAGLIGGTGALSSGQYAGVAPGVHFVVAKVLDDTGAGRTSDVVEALQFITANKDALGVQVVNMSLGHPPYEDTATDPLDQAVEQAVQAGLIVVTSAGNYGTNPDTGEVGYAGIASPGNAPDALTVGAVMTQDTETRTDDRVAPYSSRGPTWYDGFAKPDVVAPGHKLTSDAAPNSYLLNELTSLGYTSLLVGTDYVKLSGTSMAAGVTTGVVALMLQAHQTVQPDAPPLTPHAVKAILEFTSSSLNDDSGAPYDPLTQGTGEINAAGAVALSRVTRHDGGRRRLLADVARRDLLDDRGRDGDLVPEHRLGLQHRLGQFGLHELRRLGEQHRLGFQHRLGQQYRLGLQHCLGFQHCLGLEHRLGQQHRLGREHHLGQ